MVTAGNSNGLDLVASVFAHAGDVALVELPTYHFALGILRDHGLEIVGVPTDEDGLIPDELAATVDRLTAAGKRVALLYTIPTFGNPTGRTMPVERRQRVAEQARRHGFVIAEDDVYRELWFATEPPPSIWAVGGQAPVFRLGSFSKTLAPALRLGWLTGPASLVERLVGAGLLDSGGGLNPIVGLAVAEFAATGAYEPNVAALRATYRERRDALTTALRDAAPGARFVTPEGGYLVWLGLPPGMDADALLPAADAAGVTFVPGARFDASGAMDRSWVRLSYARYGATGPRARGAATGRGHRLDPLGIGNDSRVGRAPRSSRRTSFSGRCIGRLNDEARRDAF